MNLNYGCSQQLIIAYILFVSSICVFLLLPVALYHAFLVSAGFFVSFLCFYDVCLLFHILRVYVISSYGELSIVGLCFRLLNLLI